MRHCEALGNVKRIFQGSTDLDISETGEKQLECLKKRFDGIALDKIYTSPLIRARKTALAIKGERNLEVEDCEGLRELHGGIVEGKPFAETFRANPHLLDCWDNHPEDFHPEGGEAMAHAFDRIWDTVLKIAKDNKGKTVACATHGGVMRCLHCRLTLGNIKELKNMAWSDNTAVTLIEFDDNLKPNIIFVNDSSHLPEELIPKRNRLASFMAGDSK